MLNFALTKHWAIPEKIQTVRGLRTYFYEEIPGNVMFVTSPLEIPKKQSFNPEYSAKSCYSLWKFQSQKPKPIEIPHDFFFNHLGKFHFLFN